MKATKRSLTLVMMLALIVGFASPMAEPAQADAKTGTVRLSKKKITLKNKKKYKLKLKNLPKKAKVKWSITKGKKIVKLSAKKKKSVKITAVQNGTAKVTAKIKLPKKKKKKKLTCTVKVKLKEEYEPSEETPTPKPTNPPHILPEGAAELSVGADGVLQVKNLKNVYEVEIPEGTKVIPESAFAYCHTLEKVTFPEGLTEIGAKAFNDCTRLDNVTFPSTVSKVGKEAFFECSSLEHVSLNDGLLSLGAGSFFQCNSLKSIAIPSSVTELGDYLFAWCGNLESVQIDATVTEIPREMFDKCLKLKHVNIPASVTKIGSRAFGSNDAIEGLKLPDKLEEVGNGAFQGCQIGDQKINAKIIGDGAFMNCGLSKVDLGDSVTTIGKESFANAGDEGTESTLVIPASVTSIDAGTLKTWNTKEYVVEEGNPSFKSVEGVLFDITGKKLLSYPKQKKAKNYTVPDGVEEIGQAAFFQTKITDRVTVPSSVKTIEESGMENMGTKEIVLSEGLKTVGKRGFAETGCAALTLPDSVEEIGAEAFSEMVSLSSVTLSKNLKKLPFQLFENDEELKTVTIPAAVKEIHPSAFKGCRKMKDYSSLEFEEGSEFTVKDGCLLDKTGTKLLGYPVMDGYDNGEVWKISLPDEIKEIGDFAVLKDVVCVVVPDSVEKVGDYAIGYKAMMDSEKKPGFEDLLNDFYILSSSKAVLEYAKANTVDILSEEDPEYMYKGEIRKDSADYKGDESPESLIKKITLKAGETFEMKVKGVVTDTHYFSSDKNIAKVDDKGVITAVANGTTSIVECSQTMYFPLEVTVTDGPEPAKTDDKLKIFEDDDMSAVEAWEKLYFKYNSELWFGSTDYPAITSYSGDSYNAITAPFFGRDSSNWSYFITDGYGKGNGEYFVGISENLKHELAEPRLNEDILLYSGKNAKYGVDYITFDHGYSIESMLKSVGTTFTYPNVISTSLFRQVAHNYSGGKYAAILEIEGVKEKVNGMMIRYFSQYMAEMELLLNQGMKFKIKEAGVKRYHVGDPEYGEDAVKPYLRLEIVG